MTIVAMDKCGQFAESGITEAIMCDGDLYVSYDDGTETLYKDTQLIKALA